MIDLVLLFLTAVALAYTGLVVLAVWIAPKMIFPVPARGRKGIPDAFRIVIPSGIAIAARYLPRHDADRLFLYHHGNAEDLSDLDACLDAFHDHGFAVLAYDYPGYGSSEGVPSARLVIEAAEAVLAYAQKELGWPLPKIISYGRSLGGGPSLALAAKYPLAGAVTEATFTSTFRVITRWRLLPWDVFDNLALIRRAQCPLLLIHGRKDMTVPFSHAQQLLAAAPAGTQHLWIDQANHIDIVAVGDEAYWRALEAFAARRSLPHITQI